MTKKCEINECIFCELDSTKICDNCGECMFCDLDPTKICDNCGKCIDMGDYYTIKIDKIETDEKHSSAKCGRRNPHVRGGL